MSWTASACGSARHPVWVADRGARDRDGQQLTPLDEGATSWTPPEVDT